MSESLKKFDERILQMLASKKKQKVPFFRKYYTQHSQNVRNRSLTPKKYQVPIDDYLVDKIQTLAPSKINRQFNKTRSGIQKLKTQTAYSDNSFSEQHESFVEKFRRKSLQIARKSIMLENSVRKKFTKPPRKNISLEVRQINWAERKWGKGKNIGKYSQKLHPICHIYEDCADQVRSNFKKPPNPFEGYQYIRFQ